MPDLPPPMIAANHREPESSVKTVFACASNRHHYRQSFGLLCGLTCGIGCSRGTMRDPKPLYFAGRGLFALPVDDRCRPSETLASGTLPTMGPSGYKLSGAVLVAINRAARYVCQAEQSARQAAASDAAAEHPGGDRGCVVVHGPHSGRRFRWSGTACRISPALLDSHRRDLPALPEKRKVGRSTLSLTTTRSRIR